MQSLKTVTFSKIIYWWYEGLKSEKPEVRAPYISDFEKNLKDAHTKYAQNGCDTFPNELVWFHIEAKPIWKKIQKHSKNAVIC